MKKQLLLFVLMLLPMLADASVEINGIYYNLDSSYKTAEVTSNPNRYLGNVVIPEKVTYEGDDYCVTSIGELAFWFCYSLTSVTIPNSITSIGNDAFFECPSLTSVHITDLEAWCEILFGNNESNPLFYAHHLYVNGEEVKDLVIPNSIQTILKYAFVRCTGLNTVTIPNSVLLIEDSVFDECSGLTSIIIGSGINNIGYRTFANCPNLSDVYCYSENVPNTNIYAFVDSNPENVTLHVPAAAIDAYKNAEQWKDFGNIVALTDDDPKPTEIEVPKATQQSIVVEIYDLSGRCISQLQRGLNIVKMSDGTIKKIIVK